MPVKKNLFKTLYRSETNRILAGVAGGLGEYFEVDPVLIRIIFILLTVFGGGGVLIYLILWILIPNETDNNKNSEDTIRQNAQELKEKATTLAHELKGMSDENHYESFGVVYRLAGNFVFVRQFGLFKIQFILALINRVWIFYFIQK